MILPLIKQAFFNILPLWIILLTCHADIYYADGHICRNSTSCEQQLPCQLFDNVTCLLDPKENCRPRFISLVDGSEVTCSESKKCSFVMHLLNP